MQRDLVSWSGTAETGKALACHTAPSFLSFSSHYKNDIFFLLLAYLSDQIVCPLTYRNLLAKSLHSYRLKTI